jgi:hypothetical protein
VEKRLIVRPIGRFARIADTLMVPIMHVLSGSLETPQRTHRWNNKHLREEDVAHLDRELMVHSEGRPDALKKEGRFPRFHTPIFGGWRDYFVVYPDSDEVKWYVGWISKAAIGVSRIPLQGSGRVLEANEEAWFFAIHATTLAQLQLYCVGRGRIGDGGEFKDLPLR